MLTTATSPSRPVTTDTDAPAPIRTMMRAEVYKIRRHRLPAVLALVGVVAAIAPAIYLLFRSPDDPAVYLEAANAVAIIYTVLAGAVFGGWVLGHEYRQETLRRVVAVDARRGRLFAAKAIAGTVAFTVVFAAIVLSGIGSAALAAAVNDDSLVTTGLGRSIAGGAVPALIAFAVAFGTSAALRSDTYATLFSLGALVVFSPILGLIPTVGDFTLGHLTDTVSAWVGESEPLPRGVAVTLTGLVAWVGGLAAAGTALFTRRDI